MNAFSWFILMGFLSCLCTKTIQIAFFVLLSTGLCDMIYIVWQLKNVYHLYYAILFISLCRKSHSLQQYFSSFGRRFAFFHTARMQAGNLYEGNKNQHGGGEGDIEWGNSVQEKDSDSPRQNKELAHKRGASSVVWTWFGYEMSDPDSKTVQQTQTHPTSFTSNTRIMSNSRVYNSKCNTK